MTEDKGLLGRLRARGEEVFGQLSAQLMANPQFMKAMQAAMSGKQRLDAAVARGLKTMNVPTRTEFKKALRRIEALEAELAELKAGPRPARRARKPAKAAE